jgi:CBS domain-containing protein
MVGGNPGREVAVSCSGGCSDGFRLDRAEISPATSHSIGCMVVKTGGGRAAMHQMKPNNGGSVMKVKEVMHKGVDWVSPTTPVTELAKLMRAHDIGCIPIGEDDQLIGMVTDRDIVCKGLASNNFDARRATARDVMTEGIHCCREDDDLAKAVQHMEKLQLRRLPVINKSKRMVGIISLGDVSHSVSGDVLSECVRSVSAHH